MDIIKRYLDIWLILLFSFILALLILAFPSDILRIIIGLPFVLFFPGYMLAAALFIRKNSIGDIERIAFSFGLSITAVPLLGLILNYTPWGIRLYSILIALNIFIITMAIITVLRRSILPDDELFIFKFNNTFAKNLFLNAYGRCTSDTVGMTPVETPRSKPKLIDRALSAILVIVITTSIGIFIYTIATLRVSEKYSEFYILGMNGKAENYTKQIKLGESVGVIVSIVNHEQAVTSYRFIVTTDNVTIADIPSIILDTDEKYEQVVEYKTAKAGPNQRVEFQLYKTESGNPYLTLHLWINVVE